ncbi:MAG TPA: transglutaminase-like domain-containing protein [Deferrisomatales bacterium]|nr:transglutaminase-like domain-containing protein [Deferrisomatales bacterium]
MSDDIEAKYLTPTAMLDSDHAAVRGFAARAVGGSTEPVEQAVKLYYAVRDGIWYDPYSPFYLPEHYRASRVLEAGRGYCVQKAALLAAVGRAAAIPSRLSFATVKNHLATRQLLEYLDSDVFVYHGVVEMYLEGRWVKSTPAFNRELCNRHGVAPLEFDGRHDSVFQAYNEKHEKFMEYLAFHGHYADVPLDDILRAWRETYGAERVDGWIAMFEATGSVRPRKFETEDVVHD